MRNGEIPQQELLAEAPCSEQAETSQVFSEFWREFRRAVERQDKAKLFLMTRKCNFDWSPFSGPPLMRPLEIRKPRLPIQYTLLEIDRALSSDHGEGLVFATYNEFLANYEIIFSQSNRLRFLEREPGRTSECENAISWRAKALNHLCFDRVEASGYKFSGIRYDP